MYFTLDCLVLLQKKIVEWKTAICYFDMPNKLDR